MNPQPFRRLLSSVKHTHISIYIYILYIHNKYPWVDSTQLSKMQTSELPVSISTDVPKNPMQNLLRLGYGPPGGEWHWASKSGLELFECDPSGFHSLTWLMHLNVIWQHWHNSSYGFTPDGFYISHIICKSISWCIWRLKPWHPKKPLSNTSLKLAGVAALVEAWGRCSRLGIPLEMEHGLRLRCCLPFQCWLQRADKARNFWMETVGLVTWRMRSCLKMKMYQQTHAKCDSLSIAWVLLDDWPAKGFWTTPLTRGWKI